MAIERKVGSMRELMAALGKDMKDLEKRIDRAATKAARRGAAVVRRAVPVAHGELRDSVEAVGSKIRVTAPHAAAVETGSRPHMPPVGPIIEWVKLRGMQGLTGDSQRSRLPGPTSAGHAAAVAASLASHESNGAMSADAPERVAWAIAMAIAKYGTRPHWYMRGSMPQIVGILNTELNAALREK